MEKKKLWKRLLSVTLSVCMIVGLITVSEPNKAEASDGTNILENGDFASADSAWVDQNGTLVPAQTLVDDVKVTSEVKYSNDFSADSIFAWNINGTTTSVVEKDGDKVLSFTKGDNSYITYYGFSDFVVGKSYRMSCRVYSDTAVSFRLYDNATGKNDHHTTTAGAWSTYIVDLTATATQSTLYFGIMDSSTGPVYIDDVKIEQITTVINTETVYTTEFTNDFAGASPTWGWNLSNATTSVEEKDGNQVLSFTPGTNSYITNYDFQGYGGFTVGDNYRITCRVYSDTAVSFRLYDNATGTYDKHITTAGAWSTYTVDLTATATSTTLFFGFMDNSTGTVYIDDLMIAKATEATAQTYTEGIGTCKDTEPDNVLVMKDYTKVTQSVTITSGETYSYSFAVKSVDTGNNFAASVIAEDTTVQTITATSEWITVEGEFTATENATDFGFARTGEGELWIDDVVLYAIQPAPTDHTTSEGPYIPEGYINLLSGAATDFSSAEHGHTVPSGATVQNGYLKTTMASGNTIQFGGMSAVAGQTYTFSCYIWTEGTNYCLQMYEAGEGSASGSSWNTLTYNCNADTSGWVKAEYSFTAKGTGAVYIGFQQTWGGNVTAYVDDVSFTTAKLSPSDHTVQGGAYIQEGYINLLNGAVSDFSDTNTGYSLGSIGSIADGMLKIAANGVGYVQSPSITVSANETYVFSCYVWVTDATESLNFNIFRTGGAGLEWKDKACTAISSNTEGWTLLTYEFTTTSSGTVAFGFKNYGNGSGTIYVDDVALTKAKTAVTDHTTMENGGNMLPEGAKNLISNGDFSTAGSLGNGVTAAEGIASWSASSTGNYYQVEIQATAGHSYRVSYFVQVCEAGKASFDMYMSGPGSATGNWKDHILRDAASISSISDPTHTASIVGSTDGWQLVEYTWTASTDGVARIGFKSYEADAAATIYLDDLVVYDVNYTPEDHTSLEGPYIPEGKIALLSQDMSTSSNLNLTSLSTATVADGMLKLPFTQSGYIQTSSINVQANTTYTLSFYAWVCGATDGFEFNIFASGAGNGWKDKATTSITGDTYGWQLVTYEFTATSDSTIYFGFENYGTAAGTVYLDDLALSTEATGVATDITLSYGTNSNFHYEQENRLYIQSTGTTTADLTGTLKINGTEVPMTYKHYNGSLELLFGGKLSETDVNTVVIPAGTTLYNGSVKIYNIANTFTIYTKKVTDGQWMTWLNEYAYQGSEVMYYDMGTVGTKYVFNNVADITYQGVLTVTGKADIVLGGKTNASQEVTALGDYEVSRTMKGEKYDYTVALYKRGDADKTQDGALTVQDLVAAKKAVSAAPDTFGHARYKAADSNTDGTVNEKDAAFMRYILVHDEYDITTTTSKGYSTLGQGVMPIVGYGGPSDDNTKQNTEVANRSTKGGVDNLLTDEVFGLVKDLGFNVFTSAVHEVGADYETSTRMLKLAEKYGLSMFINNAYISSADTAVTELPIQTAKYDSFASFYGYYIKDEPEDEADISNYTAQLTALKNHVNIASYFNMHPIWNFSSDSTYKSYLSAAANTDAESLSYDLYLRSKSYLITGSKIRTADFYKNLDIARTQSAGATTEKPFQAYIQTGANWIDKSTDSVSANNRLTIQEMFLEANAALAMGAKGIHYFTLVESVEQVAEGDTDSGLITIAGQANHNEGGNYDYYNAAKKINTYITAIDEVLMNATSKGVITNNSTVTDNVSCEMSSYGVVGSVTGSEYMIGCFDYYGKDAYLIVNITPDEGGTGSSQSITLNFNEEVTYDYIFMDGTKGTATGITATGTIQAGESVLVVVE